MTNKVIIRQPAGIGDIFFCQKIAHALHQHYQAEIIWPVISEFIWIKDYIKTPFIEFADWESDFEGKQLLSNNDVSYVFTSGIYTVVPLQRADWNFPGMSVMDAKYHLLGLDFEDWRDYFNFDRNTTKENQLYYDVLGLTDDSNYVFINRQFASPPHTTICEHIKLERFASYVEMRYLDNFTIFDWCKVLENASEIHTVETSINYIIEKINTKAKLEMYSKHNPPNYTQVQHLFKANWNYNG